MAGRHSKRRLSMVRRKSFTLGVALVLAASAVEARAQYYPGYGNYGWGGWGGGGATVEGSMARGLGYYDVGVGERNELDAEAASINENTIARWNQYVYLSQQEANRREYLRRARLQNRDSRSGDAYYQRIRDNPQVGDIESGDALNVVLNQLTDPRVHSSALRMAKDTIPAKAIAEIPFANASEGITLSLHQLTASEWPSLLQVPELADAREAYKKAIDQALKEDEEGTVSAETLELLRATVGQIRARLEPIRANLSSLPPAERARFTEASNYVRTLAGMAKMLENPRTEKVLAELKKVDETTVGSLLGFMHTYNLRFGRADTPAQREVYDRLFPLLVATRDKIVKEADDRPSDYKASGDHPAEFFSGMHLDDLHGNGKSSK